MKLTEHQSEALAIATSGKVGLLTGVPGSGKTTTVSEYIRGILQRNGRGSIGLAAPYGKAARRFSQALRENGLQIDATTVHRMLGYMYVDGHGEFAYNRGNKLPHSHVVIDESSTLEVPLMAALMAARRKGAQILFVGDPNQLPPVGHGSPLRDMLQMKLPHGHLSEIHRNAGRIVQCCKDIVERKTFQPSLQFDFQEGENFVVDGDWQNVEGQIEVIEQYLCPSSALFDASDGVVDPIWDCQVICPLAQKQNPVARIPLNKTVRAMLNPNGLEIKGNPFWRDDKITCTKNGWYLSAPGCPPEEITRDGKVGCSNGEQAKAIEVDAKWTIAELDYPKRLVRIGKTKSTTEEDAGRWDLAYVGSVHKSQGSEYPGVILVGDESNGARWLADRHLLMTAISRASRGCVAVAKLSTLRDWCRKSHLWKRETRAVPKYFELLVAK